MLTDEQLHSLSYRLYSEGMNFAQDEMIEPEIWKILDEVYDLGYVKGYNDCDAQDPVWSW